MPWISDQELQLLRARPQIPGAPRAVQAPQPWRNAYAPPPPPVGWQRGRIQGTQYGDLMGRTRHVDRGGQTYLEEEIVDPVTGGVSVRSRGVGDTAAFRGPQTPAPSVVPQQMREAIDRQQAAMGADWTFVPTPGAGGGYWRPNSPAANSAQGQEMFSRTWAANQAPGAPPGPPPTVVTSQPPTAAATQTAAISPPVTPPTANPQTYAPALEANTFRQGLLQRANQLAVSAPQPQLSISQPTAKPPALASPGQGAAPIQPPTYMAAPAHQRPTVTPGRAQQAAVIQPQFAAELSRTQAPIVSAAPMVTPSATSAQTPAFGSIGFNRGVFSPALTAQQAQQSTAGAAGASGLSTSGISSATTSTAGPATAISDPGGGIAGGASSSGTTRPQFDPFAGLF